MSRAHEGPLIHLAFRFHGNFYHSYRGDTPDERGFGKDIRIVGHLIDELDRFNGAGVPVRGTWDFENHFSLERIMPQHCPELIEGLQRRVRDHGDEMELMSWNNGLVNAHTEEEFDAAIGRAISNAEGSGVADLFDSWTPIVRPQEMMFTPDHLRLYRKHGVEAVSLYYSALPFNGFSSFVPPLSLRERYNPLTLSYPGMDETLTLIPTYGIGDVADQLTLRGWLRRMRRQQMRAWRRGGDGPADVRSGGAGAGGSNAAAQDLLLLIDMDADDEFWVGLAGTGPLGRGLGRVFPTVGGLRRIVESVADLPWLRFTTPGRYLAAHEPVGDISFGQDTADGSFDGLSSWAEKHSSQELWTLLEHSRLYSMQARELLRRAEGERARDNTGEDGVPAGRRRAADLLQDALELRLRALSTTHFGMSAPVMNVTRLQTGYRLLVRSRAAAREALEMTGGAGLPELEPAHGSRWRAAAGKSRQREAAAAIFTYSRADVGDPGSSDADSTGADPVRPTLLRFPVGLFTGDEEGASAPAAFQGNALRAAIPLAGTLHLRGGGHDAGREVPALYLPDCRYRGPQVLAAAHLPDTDMEVRWRPESFEPVDELAGAPALGRSMQIGPWSLTTDPVEGLTDLRFQGRLLGEAGSGSAAGEGLFSTGLRYAGRLRRVRAWQVDSLVQSPEGGLAFLAMSGSLRLNRDDAGAGTLLVRREIILSRDLPWLTVYTRVSYPTTPDHGYEDAHAERLEQAWDARWQEVMPLELHPDMPGSGGPRVWKHNYAGGVTSFRPDYSDWSRNRQLDSVNNQVTGGWVALSSGEQGLLLAQNTEIAASMAFCPIRTRQKRGAGPDVNLNPFGTYDGRQYRYPTARTGLGRFVAVHLSASDHVRSYAPSFNGATQEFELMIAPYEGNAPPAPLQEAALRFSFGAGIRSSGAS